MKKEEGARPTWACLKEAIACGLVCGEGSGLGREDDKSLVRMPMKPPMVAPWAALVAVTTAASTGKNCLDSQPLNPASNSLYKFDIHCNFFFVFCFNHKRC